MQTSCYLCACSWGQPAPLRNIEQICTGQWMTHTDMWFSTCNANSALLLKHCSSWRNTFPRSFPRLLWFRVVNWKCKSQLSRWVAAHMELWCISKGERSHLVAHCVLSKTCWAVTLIALCCVQTKMFVWKQFCQALWICVQSLCMWCWSKVKMSLNNKKKEQEIKETHH